jgi:hypothetical protein
MLLSQMLVRIVFGAKLLRKVLWLPVEIKKQPSRKRQNQQLS